MSHVTKIKTVEVRDIDALRTTVAELNKEGVRCSLVTNAVPRMYYNNQHERCDYVVQLHDSPYDVGFAKQGSGAYAPVFDAWAGKVASQVGASCPMPDSQEAKQQHAIGKLMQGYARNAAINAATLQGYSVTGCNVDASGSVQIEIEV